MLDSFDGALGSVSFDTPEMEKVRDGVSGIYAQLAACSRRRASSASRPTACRSTRTSTRPSCRTTATTSPASRETMRTGLPPQWPGPASGDGPGDAEGNDPLAPQREWFEKDYYSVLGVPQSATEKEITRAYRKLAKEFHPDANAGQQGGRGALQGGLRGQRRARRRREAQGVRPGPRDGRVGRGPGWRSGPVGSARPGGFPVGRVPEHPASRTSATPADSATSSATSSAGVGGGRPARPRAPGRPPARPRPRDRAPPRLPRRGPRHHHVGEHHRRSTVLGVRWLRRQARNCSRCLHHVWWVGRGRRRPGPLLVLAGVPHLRRSGCRREGQVQALQGSWHRGAPARRSRCGCRPASTTGSASG